MLRRLPQSGIVVVGDDDYLRFREGCCEFARDHDSVDVFESDIHQDPIGTVGFVSCHCLAAVFALKDLMSRCGYQAANGTPHTWTVIDDQNVHSSLGYSAQCEAC